MTDNSALRPVAVKRPGLRSAIDQHCKQCVYDQHCPGTWRQQVMRCEALACALWPVRPKAIAYPRLIAASCKDWALKGQFAGLETIVEGV